MKIRINEIFTSLSGEPDGFGNKGGLATFIRFQGCNLSCKYCDTLESRDTTHGCWLTIAKIVSEVTTEHVIVTGGEPLMQREAFVALTENLLECHHCVTVETNGTLTLPFHGNLRYVVDYKLPSAETLTVLPLESVYYSLSENDIIKFILTTIDDYHEAVRLVQANNWKAKIVFSPLIGPTTYASLFAKLMLTDRLENVTLSLQLHKLLQLR
jgi:7-carboxy-7-deazaguanine synthase